REIANKNEKIASEREKEAIAANKESLRQRYIAIAKAMAIKSKELNGDKDQQSLLAQQAFNFNNEYGGYAFDNDIYN
ncbi:hypothetical protein KK062_30735, partial [Fulvivirgaceae bacterium PWU5]